MFITEKVLMSKSASESSQTFNTNSRRECEEIMDTIYKENPSYWPYGLSIGSHDGGVYMIREASTRKPIGFTGWQERDENGVRVGYYSIGILADYRNNGYAKQAVAKLINIKAANVDRVQALIMKHNQPSLALADKLGIPVIKAGSVKSAMSTGTRVGLGALAGVGGAGFMDALTFGRDKTWEEYRNAPITVSRGANAILNTGLAGGIMVPGLAPATRLGMLTSIPAKDFALSAIPAVGSATDSLKQMAEKPEAKNMLQSLSTGQKAGLGSAAVAGLLGAGYLGHKALKALSKISDSQAAASGGRIRVALPTKDPNDEETTLDLPMGDLEVSNSQLTKLQRDLRRRIRRETKERTATRPVQNLLGMKEATAYSTNSSKIKDLLNLIYG